MWTQIRDEMARLLGTVSGITVVHSYPRLARDRQPSRWIKWMRDRSRINAWTVFRESNTARYLTCNEVEVTDSAVLVGILEHDDERKTQDEFDNLLDAVLNVFYLNYRLDNKIDIQGPAIIRVEELRQVGEEAIHYAEISISAKYRVHVR